jgi:hypothetical protein
MRERERAHDLDAEMHDTQTRDRMLGKPVPGGSWVAKLHDQDLELAAAPQRLHQQPCALRGAAPRLERGDPREQQDSRPVSGDRACIIHADPLEYSAKLRAEL